MPLQCCFWLKGVAVTITDKEGQNVSKVKMRRIQTQTDD